MSKLDDAMDNAMARMAPGGGGRFAMMKEKLSKKKGIKNPGALAAYIGRKKYGKKKFQAMAAAGKKDGK